MKASIAIGLAVIAVVIAGLALFNKSDVTLGSATNCTDGYTCLTNLEVQGNLLTDATTTVASSLSLTKPAACVNFFATSTATAGKMVFVTTGATSTYNGTVYWQYGSCS